MKYMNFQCINNYANFDDEKGAYVNVSALILPASIWRMYHLIRRSVKDLSSKLRSRP